MAKNYLSIITLNVNALNVPIKRHRVAECIKTRHEKENQDGGVGRHTAPPRTTRTDRKSNGKEVTKEIKNKHSPRPVGGVEMGSWGSRAEGTKGNTARPRDVADCGTNGAGSATASRPRSPTFAHT